MTFPDQNVHFQYISSLRTQQTILTCKRIYIIQQRQIYCKPLEQPQIERAIALILEYVKSEENVCDYYGRHPYKDLLKVKELIHYVNFVADNATPNALTKNLKIFTKNDKLLHEVIKLARQNNCYKLNNPLTFLESLNPRLLSGMPSTVETKFIKFHLDPSAT